MGMISDKKDKKDKNKSEQSEHSKGLSQFQTCCSTARALISTLANLMTKTLGRVKVKGFTKMIKVGDCQNQVRVLR